MLHGALGEKLAELQLCVVERPVASNVSWNVRLLARVDQHFLPVDHELVVAEIAANDNIANLLRMTVPQQRQMLRLGLFGLAAMRKERLRPC